MGIFVLMDKVAAADDRARDSATRQNWAFLLKSLGRRAYRF